MKSCKIVKSYTPKDDFTAGKLVRLYDSTSGCDYVCELNVTFRDLL